MECFFLFDFEQSDLCFHVEYCTERAVHTADGVVVDTKKLFSVTKTSEKGELLKYLTKDFSSGDRFFPFLRENGIEFRLTEKSYADTSSDV